MGAAAAFARGAFFTFIALMAFMAAMALMAGFGAVRGFAAPRQPPRPRPRLAAMVIPSRVSSEERAEERAWRDRPRLVSVLGAGLPEL